MIKNLLKLEWNKIKYPYLISLGVGILYSCLIILPFISGYSYNHKIEIWQQSNQVFDLIFPLLAVLPSCWLMYYERKNNFFIYNLTRVSKKKYIISKWLMTSIGSAMIIFVVSFAGLIFCLKFTNNVKLNAIKLNGYDTSLKEFYGYYLANKPYLYGLILSVWRAVIGFIIGTFGFVLSLYINNIFIILTGPFVYVFIESYMFAILGVPYYSIVTSFDPSILIAKVISLKRILVGPFLLIMVICIISIYFSCIKKKSIHYI
ncbi:ABC-2 family transporter protein [Clostridium tepidiprofundi DSM 19306]|uniref:ABC-2 family transporter protein n=1 Tax=Clostridium tepidiprofundi DSM 19306 TaxID=1121338 RepID=A0A151ASB9_9CLOT|nr:ABC transporter permease [Clostridium tepidiprofundi]KYH30548.1 ABC-2 family transporter protein [Clostridium tepidiprofundi DSM 19306]